MSIPGGVRFSPHGPGCPFAPGGPYHAEVPWDWLTPTLIPMPPDCHEEDPEAPVLEFTCGGLSLPLIVVPGGNGKAHKKPCPSRLQVDVGALAAASPKP